MPRTSRISDTYWRRLRLSTRDVLVAAALTMLAGGAILAALWKVPSLDERLTGTAIHAEPD